MSILLFWYALPIAYLIGALPFGWLFCKWLRGVDIREVGSGSTGATNVSRVLGRRWSILVFLLDVGKGVLVVAIAQQLSISAEWALVLGIVAIIGHCFSVFLRFRGGKGVATALGVALATSPAIAVCAFALWGVILAAFRYISLASMVAITAFAVANFVLRNHFIGLTFVVLAVFVVYTHRDNIQRLRAGTESKVGAGKRG